MPQGSQGISTGSAPLCFVLMPFGRKTDSTSGVAIDFDAVYQQIIAPAIRDAGFDPIRADEEKTGGVIYKPMFERLILCDYAVADLTMANPNVFYELGVRHAVRPYSTVLTCAAGTRHPFDLLVDRVFPYALSATGSPVEVQAAKTGLTGRLSAARERATDSPVFQLVDGFPNNIDRLKTDVFRDQTRYSEQWKERLAQAREEGIDAVRAAEHDLGNLGNVEVGILIDLLLSYRAAGGWQEMISLVEHIPEPLAKVAMIQEQYGLALNRLGRRGKATRVLLGLIGKRGPSSETYGILGRVYKDEWNEAQSAGNTSLADGLLALAIDTYLKGFEADWRDAYPGINAVTLMELRDPPDPRRKQLIPVVSYAAQRRLVSAEADYWDHATLLELAVLAKDQTSADEALTQALATAREGWEAKSTAGNLKMIREARERRGDNVPWAKALETELLSWAAAH